MKAYLWKSCAQKDSRSRRARDEKGEAAHLFGISLSSVKRYARAWSTYVVNLGQGQPTCRDDEGCAPPPDRSPPKCNNPPMARPRQQIAETALETATSPDRGASSFLWCHTQTERRVWVSHPQVAP